MRVLVVNAGSTSVKVSLVDDGGVVQQYDGIDGALHDAQPDAVAHRVVHGGTRTAAALVNDDLVAELRALTDLAPLHQPPALDAINRCRAALPDVRQVACFDTAFHVTIPAEARTYALPARWRETVRVYGFHGLSYAWIAGRLPSLAPAARRVVVAHLGGGQSLCGLLDGRSVVTTMGFTPLDGLVMATRSGSLDPGAVLWLAQREDDLGAVLERESGLLGLSGTGDMQELLARTDDDARLAVEVYLHRLVGEVGRCVAALGGLDALVFTGGVGEHAAGVREAVAERFAWLGVAVDPDAEGEDVSAPSARVRTFVVTAAEDRQAATETESLLT